MQGQKSDIFDHIFWLLKNYDHGIVMTAVKIINEYKLIHRHFIIMN